MSNQAELREWCKDQCARLISGECTTRRCLVRGGYKFQRSVLADIATCEAKEIYDLLEAKPRDASGGLAVETNIVRARALTNYLHSLEAKGEEIPDIVDRFWFDLSEAILKYDEVYKNDG